MSLNEVTANSRQDIAIFFGNYFSSIYSPNINSFTPTNLYNYNSVDLNNIEVTINDIFEGSSFLKPKRTYGPDGIPPMILRYCRYSLAPPIFPLFKLSLSSSSFPTLWKSIFIQPTFKSGDRPIVENYRPISILSAIPSFLIKYLQLELNTVTHILFC